jgi:hypothetical protein
VLATRYLMKMFSVILVLAAMTGSLRAQDLGTQDVRADRRTQEAQNVFAVRPYVTRGDLAGSRFFTRSRITLGALDGAAMAADGYITRRNIDAGGEENNPLARPFVHTTAVQVGSTAALFAAEVATAYILHRRGHDGLGRSVLAGGAVLNGLGAASSYKHRVPGW